MKKIIQIEGKGIVIRGDDIDTDQIIPARYMTAVTFEGIEEFAFFDVRYNADGSKIAHPFNEERFKDANIMIVNSNFGCGSSREHAPQTIMRHGIEAIIGESFAEIFAGNCTTLGVPVLNMDKALILAIQDTIEQNPNTPISFNLETSQVKVGEKTYPANIIPQIQNTLTQGTWDTTRVLLANNEHIEKTFEDLPYITNFS